MAINKALLRLDPDKPEHVAKLHAGTMSWWGSSSGQADALIKAWKNRPSPDKRINLSRRALVNLLPWMRQGLSVTEARQRFAGDRTNAATVEQRDRYKLNASSLTKADRHFMQKHPDLLPPAPELANPVIRKAIHEVRRHILAYLKMFDGQRPDRIVIELTRSATQSERVRNEALARNRKREAERKKIIIDFGLGKMSPTQQRRTVERVLLCRQQNSTCAYSELEQDAARAIAA